MLSQKQMIQVKEDELRQLELEETQMVQRMQKTIAQSV